MYVVEADKQTCFEFELDGKVYKVPLLRHMPLNKLLAYNKALRKVKPGMEADFYIDFVSDIFNEHAPSVCERLTVDQFKSLMEAYIAESNVSPGEFGASSD